MKKQKYKQRFTDSQFVELYNKGLSDLKISKIMGCCLSTIYYKRTRLKLIANIFPRLSEEELEESNYRQYLRTLATRNKLYHNKPSFAKRRRINAKKQWDKRK